MFQVSGWYQVVCELLSDKCAARCDVISCTWSCFITSAKYLWLCLKAPGEMCLRIKSCRPDKLNSCTTAHKPGSKRRNLNVPFLLITLRESSVPSSSLLSVVETYLTRIVILPLLFPFCLSSLFFLPLFSLSLLFVFFAVFVSFPSLPARKHKAEASMRCAVKRENKGR